MKGRAIDRSAQTSRQPVWAPYEQGRARAVQCQGEFFPFRHTVLEFLDLDQSA